jgi:hypothetical protein
MTDADDFVVKRWAPNPLDRDSKRKARQSDPWANGGQYPRATACQLEQIIGDMGFNASDAVKKDLLDQLNGFVFNVADVLRRQSQKPPASELTEMLDSVRGAVGTLLRTLDLHEPAEEIYRAVGISRRMNPAVLEQLTTAAATLQGVGIDWRNADLVTRSVRAAAVLGVLAENRIAQLRADPANKSERWERPISRSLAQLYREAFGHRPAQRNGSPWLKFLKWTLKIAGSPTAGSSDDALRKLPISQSKK